MKVSYNWLKEFIDLNLSPEETAEKLTLIGLEVDSIESYGSALEGVIVGEVLEVREHPNADRLRLCKVDLGEQQVQIVCGAKNVAAKQKVAVATVGTTLPVPLDDGSFLTIRSAELRGEKSEGMICSETELGLGDDHSGIMVLKNGASAGQPIGEVLELYEDTIIDIEISPNRPDATCHLGVARDLAAALDLELTKPFRQQFQDAGTLEGLIDVRIENSKKCPRYVAKIVRDIKIGESPTWLKNRLKVAGVRPVNNVVDATNYVLLELGQPLHAFDYNSIRGKTIVVKDFKNKIEFETLDHVKRTCSPGTLFICDGEGPVAIAGVMGGVDSEVSNETTEVLIESAYFDPGSIRRTAKEQTLQTDASYRFERGIDPGLQRIAAERCADLIAEIAGGTIVEGVDDLHPVKTEQKELELRVDYVNRLLGTTLEIKEIKQLLNGLELELIDEKSNTLTYRVPLFRPDLEREVDLVEEVGRLFDYNNIPAPAHAKFLSPEPISRHEKFLDRIRNSVKALRFKEIYTNSLLPEEEAGRLVELDKTIQTLNPISKEMTTLRPSLIPGFLKSVAYNFNRKVPQLRFFEIGNVFRSTEGKGTWFEGIEEETSLLVGIGGSREIEHWKTEPVSYDLFDLKQDVTALLKQLGIGSSVKTENRGGILTYTSGDVVIGSLQAVDTRVLTVLEIEQPVYAAEFSLTRIEQQLSGLPGKSYTPVSRFPSFEFDLAVVADAHIPAGDMMKTIEHHAGDLLRDIQIFDVFESASVGESKKSIAFRLSFLDNNKTLTINDIEPIIDKVLKALEKHFSAKLRS